MLTIPVTIRHRHACRKNTACKKPEWVAFAWNRV